MYRIFQCVVVVLLAACASVSQEPWPEREVSILQMRPREPLFLGYHYRLMDGAPKGDLVLRLHVSAEGMVRGVRLVKSSGHPNLDEGAMQSAWKASFHPFHVDGQAVPVSVLYGIRK